MSRLLFIALLIYVVLAESCIISDKKGKPDIRVIELEDSEESNEVVALHLPNRRKREVNQANQELIKTSRFCKSDEDCGPGAVCVAYLACVKGTWRTISSRERSAAN